MRVAVKNMSGVFTHSTTPRKARLLLKEKKAVIESNNPFTIRLLFSESECGLKDSKSLNKFNSGLLPEKDITMCDNRKETEELHNAYGNYIQPSLNVIMANPKNKRIKWCSKDSNSENGENSPESFAQTLYDACTMLYQQTDGNYSGNYVYIGKRGFELLQKLDPKRFWKMDNWIGIDYAIKVHYITTMPKNNFIVGINNKYFKERDKFIVGSIVDEECSEKSESEEAIEQQKQSDNNKSEKDKTMCESKETAVLVNKFNEFYDFTLRSIRHIFNSTSVDKVTWYTASEENDPDSFANMLCSAGLMLFTKNHRVNGNFVLTGKQGFDILKKIGSPRISFEEDACFIDSKMKVRYIPAMDENRFIISVYEPINFADDDYKKYYRIYYTIYENMDALVVGEIVNGEQPNENIEAKSEMNDKCDTVSDNSIKYNSKTHLIFGATGCGKTTMFKRLIQEKLNRDEDVFVLGTEIFGRLYFNDKSNNKLHFYSPKDLSGFSSKVDPKDLAEYIVNFCYSVVGKDNTRTIAIDGFEQFNLNPDYTTVEYFRELVKKCRTNDINLLYILNSDKKESYHNLSEIYERFSDIITIIK